MTTYKMQLHGRNTLQSVPQSTSSVVAQYKDLQTVSKAVQYFCRHELTCSHQRLRRGICGMYSMACSLSSRIYQYEWTTVKTTDHVTSWTDMSLLKEVNCYSYEELILFYCPWVMMYHSCISLIPCTFVVHVWREGVVLIVTTGFYWLLDLFGVLLFGACTAVVMYTDTSRDLGSRAIVPQVSFCHVC